MSVFEDKNVLFSIVVITYNSSKYIEDTLDSIYNQTYKNIELIISDDFSTDDTIEICSNWIKKNKDRFVNTKIITTEINTGIPANCNRGLLEAGGEWIKFIAGDDALFYDAIDSVVKFVRNEKKISILSSNVAYFNNTLEDENLFKIRYDQDKLFYQLSASKQYFSLLHGNKIHALGVFIKNKLLKDLGGFDEKYRLLEDHPMWLKITKSGNKFYYLNKVLGKYRVHDSSVFSTINDEVIFNDYYLKKRKFEKDYIYPNISIFYKVAYNYNYLRDYLFDFLRLNNDNKRCRFLYNLSNYISPLVIKKRLSKYKNKTSV